MAAGGISVVAVVRSQETGAALSALADQMNGTRIEVRTGTLEALGFAAGESAPDVLLVDLDPHDQGQLEQLEEVLSARPPGLPVVATAAALAVQDVRRLLRLGVVDVVPRPIERAELKTAIEHAARALRPVSSAPEQQGVIIGFAKAAGGMGATTLAVQSAAHLAARAQGRGACLLDLDFQFGVAALYLDLDNRFGVADLLEAPERLDAELLRSVMAQHDSGLEVLAAPRDLVALDSVTPDFIGDCIRLVRRTYGVAVLDLPTTWTAWSHRAMEACDLLFLVTQLSVAGVRQARRQLDAIEAHGLGDVPLRVVLNRFSRRGWGARLDVREAEKALGRPVDYLVANDYRTVSAALNQGVCLSGIRRKTKVEADIRTMIEESLRALSSGHASTAAGPASASPSRALWR